MCQEDDEAVALSREPPDDAEMTKRGGGVKSERGACSSWLENVCCISPAWPYWSSTRRFNIGIANMAGSERHLCVQAFIWGM